MPKNTSFYSVVLELIPSQTKLEAQLLHDSMKGWQISPDHLVRLWREYQNEEILTAGNIENVRAHFDAWAEKAIIEMDGK
ncbi:hypothetical protein BCU85_17355 [Vibrio lentus]|uniref:hypothetical protein n=1 Tax=Vibrio lentus TaxID=136468 RepID=UPI000C85E0EC|nr:hypothetical protein [Vibrio lentus]MCC4818027.1 hypothetical protein [Vibrio lentus]PMG72964.1 hypothetical protein BCU85_17355 [Vibrio lentus]PMK89922.1 hypothetical protein BCT88_21370 [Vibrio lentus]PML25476.1 hypothetical protein BCT80_19500 [Vibrio lentus]PMM27950.1 hypothetical protein BCT57_15815 [Vibrio lentus]